MSTYATSRAMRYLPQVALATAAVVVAPVGVVWWLYSDGVVTSYWLCLGLAVLLSLTASVLGNAYWKRRRGAGDLFFSELLLWGWLRRLVAERRASGAVRLLSLTDTPAADGSQAGEVAQTARLLERLSGALDAQDPYTDGHSRRVALHAALIARRLGLPREEAAKLQAGATLHDIGKLRVSAEILNKPGKLTYEEFELAKRHVDEGAQIVSFLGDAEIVAMVRHHHERFDGSGYPSGLVGEQTPLGARIIAVADTFDALTSVRPYRPAVSHRQALKVVAEVSGSQLDPVVVRAFLKCYSGRRLAVFWTLLAISPGRALAFAGARRSAVGVGSPTAMVAGAAAVTAVAAAAFGPSAPLGRASYQLGRVTPSTPAAVSAQPARSKHHAHAKPTPRSKSTPRRSRARPPAPSPAHPTLVATAPVRRSSVQAITLSRPPTRVVRRGTKPRPHPGHPIAPPPITPAIPPPALTGAPSGPQTMEDCKNGNYAQYGFPNQGLCVASVAPRH